MTAPKSTLVEREFSFDEIAEQFITGQQELKQLRDLCAQLLDQNRICEDEAKISKVRLELATSTNIQLRHDLQLATRDLNALQYAIATKNTTVLQTKGNTAPFINVIEAQRQHQGSIENNLTFQRRQVKQLQSQVNNFTKEHADLKQEHVALSIENDDLKADLQFLRASADIAGLQALHRPEGPSDALATPFILTIIDGDAYKWSPNLFSVTNRPPHTTPGGYIAYKLRTTIQTYLLQSQNNIPLSSALVVQVLCNNTNASPTSTNMFPGLHRQLAPTFMQQFTESSPLFDYHAVGVGKERVDSKINAMINLFIRNPACHKLFLAVGPDNGFARTLEQYTHDPVSRSKICIISSGIIGAEIAALKLEEVEWPEIFWRKVPNPHSPRPGSSKRGKGKKKQKAIKKEEEEQPSLEIRSDWIYKCAASEWRMMGFKNLPKTAAVVDHEDGDKSGDELDKEETEVTECGNDGYCFEDGVD